jgi:hypothetical protein
MEKNRIGKDKAVLYIVLGFVAAIVVYGVLRPHVHNNMTGSLMAIAILLTWGYTSDRIWELTK